MTTFRDLPNEGVKTITRRALAVVFTATLLAAAASLALFPVGQARAASWSVREVAVEATILPSGDMTIVETRTYDFPESFRWVEQWIPISGCAGISGMTVSESRTGTDPQTLAYAEVDEIRAAAETPGTYLVNSGADMVAIRYWFEKATGLRTFTLAYTVDDPVLVHDDVAELCWKFVGNAWEAATKHVLVNLHLPYGATADDVQAWGHGPLQGRVQVVDPTLVRFEVYNLEPQTYVEGRVAFPTSLVPAATNRSGRDGLPGILVEEEGLAAQANADRARLLWNAGLAVALLLAAVVYGWWLMRRYGLERRPAESPDYYRDLPGTYSPAVLGALWHFGNPGPNDFVATILDLARRGYLAIEEAEAEVRRPLGLGTKITQDYRFWRRTRPPVGDTLLPHEQTVLKFVLDTPPLRGRRGAAALPFADEKRGIPGLPAGVTGRPVLLSEIQEASKDNSGASGRYRLLYQRWRRQAEAAARTEGFFEKESERGQALGALSGVALMIVSAYLAATRHLLPGVTGFVCGGGLLVLCVFLSRRSQKGADQLRLWQAFRRYLHDFSRLEEAEPPAVALWDHYLVYAVSLGVAKEVVRQLPLVYDQERLAQGLTFAWFMTGGRLPGLDGKAAGFAAGLGRGLEGLTSFSSVLASSLQGNLSSGRGRGGGFSGGGRGGGGGVGRGGSAGG